MAARVYILQNQKGVYYVGATEDLARRLSEHARGQSPSMRHRGPWELVYTEIYSTFLEAHRRELEIKRKKRKMYIDMLIQSNQ